MTRPRNPSGEDYLRISRMINEPIPYSTSKIGTKVTMEYLLTPKMGILSQLDRSRDRLVDPIPPQVWKLANITPDVAVAAYGEQDARKQIESALGRELTSKDALERVR